MGRTYTRKTTRGSYGADSITGALKSISQGTPLKTAARQYGVPAKTLRRHRDGAVMKPGSISLGRFKQELNEDHEAELVIIIQKMEKALYGLSTTDVRKLAFDFATKVGIAHRFNQELKIAGTDWLRGFLKRHPELSIRQPEATNISRAVGFNQPQVKLFYERYRDLLSAHTYTPMKIWNADETGISNVQKPVKVIATKGARVVGRITSGERGRTVTVMCAMNAAGSFIPPMFIYPRKRMIASLLNGAPPGAIGICTSSGWTDSECFLQWLKHFADIAKPSLDDKHLIILDGHHSHKTLEAVLFARDHGIELITLPPHCTHKMQPLDTSFFKGLKAAYNAAADNWMLCNKGRRISFYEISGLFSKAYMKAATIEKAVAGFEGCGLWPFNDERFSEDDFVASRLTDEAMPVDIQAQQRQIQSEQQPADQLQSVPVPVPVPVQLPQPEIVDQSEQQPADQLQSVPVPVQLPQPEIVDQSEQQPAARSELQVGLHVKSFYNSYVSPERALAKAVFDKLCGPIQATDTRTRKRKAEQATILTSSPYKKLLLEKKKCKQGGDKDKSGKQKDVKTGIPREEKHKQKAKKGSGKYSRSKKGKDKVQQSDYVPCHSCNVRFCDDRSGRKWIQCQEASCLKWFHNECQGLDEDFNDANFFCIECEY